MHNTGNLSESGEDRDSCPLPPTFFLPHWWGEDRRRGIKIFDVSGKLIKEIEILRSAQNDKPSGSEVTISLNGINPGMYFLRLGKETKKFLVIK